MSNNVIYIAAAGSGKTTLIIDKVKDELRYGVPDNKKIAIITYTYNNQDNIKRRLISKNGSLPTQVKVMGWYSFLLDYLIRPFKGEVLTELYDHHIGLCFVEGVSGTFHLSKGRTIKSYKKGDLWGKFFCSNKRDIYSDKLSEFAMMYINKEGALLIDRLSRIFDTIFLDESQDLACWDFEIIKELIISQKINVVLCGDPRQNTLSTSLDRKYKLYNGQPDKYAEDKINKKRQNYVTIDNTSLSKSHRCVEEICALASSLFPDFPPLHSCECARCKQNRDNYQHIKGMFLLKESDVLSFVKEYSPISLIWDKKSIGKVKTDSYYNYSQSKGLEFDSVIVYPTKVVENYLIDGAGLNDLPKRKLYVAITRARYTCCIVISKDFDKSHCGLPFWKNRK